jgi:hypothetical protein
VCVSLWLHGLSTFLRGDECHFGQVHYNPDVAGPRLIVRAVEDAGFKAAIVDSHRCTSFGHGHQVVCGVFMIVDTCVLFLPSREDHASLQFELKL